MSRRGTNIRKRADGRWEGRYYIVDTAGSKKCKSVYGHSYKEVIKKYREIQKNVQKERKRLDQAYRFHALRCPVDGYHFGAYDIYCLFYHSSMTGTCFFLRECMILYYRVVYYITISL